MNINPSADTRVPTAVILIVLAALTGGGCAFPGMPPGKLHGAVPERCAVEAAALENPPLPVPSSDLVAERLQIMEERVDELTTLLAAKGNPRPPVRVNDEGRLRDLERKAVQSDALTLELSDRNKENQELATALSETRATLASQNEELLILRRRTNDMAKVSGSLQREIDPLKEMLRVLRLGNYEYYTIQPDDTCESIAEQPMIYGERSKHTLIRQMNRGLIADLDKLMPGEALIIPRLEGNGNHDF